MPKHIHREDYLKNPVPLVPSSTIYPDIQHNHDSDAHHILPAVFMVKKGNWFTITYPGPGPVCFVTEGELIYEDVKSPGQAGVIIGAGGVGHIEHGDILRWCSPSEAKNVVAVWAPASVKGYESFVVPG